jgi:hypothetical protein
VGALALTSLSLTARAELEEPVAIRIEGFIPCTSEEDFFARVQHRAPGARRGQPSEPTRTFTISLMGSAASVYGRLAIVHLDGRSSTREVTGESCADVVDALALITAVDIDPAAAGATSVDPSAPEPVLPTPDAIAPPSSPPPLARAERWHVGAGVEPSVTARVAPQSLYGLPIYVELTSPSTSVLSPSLILGFERTFNSTTEATQGDAAFDLVGGFLQACPIAWISARARAGPCLRFDAGRLEGAGKGGKSVVSPHSDSRPWFALGVVGRASFRLGGPLFLGAQVGLGVPLVQHYRFELDPQIPLGEVESWNWRAGIGLAVRFL